MIIQADEHVILIARAVDLEGSAWEGFGSSRRFCKSITPSTPKGHVPTSDKATDHHCMFTHTCPQIFNVHKLGKEGTWSLQSEILAQFPEV